MQIFNAKCVLSPHIYIYIAKVYLPVKRVFYYLVFRNNHDIMLLRILFLLNRYPWDILGCIILCTII